MFRSRRHVNVDGLRIEHQFHFGTNGYNNKRTMNKLSQILRQLLPIVGKCYTLRSHMQNLHICSMSAASILQIAICLLE